MFSRVFQSKIVTWTLLAISFAGPGSARAEGPVCDLTATAVPIGEANAGLPGDLDRIFSQTEPGGCIAELTDEDRAFLLQLAEDQSDKIASLTKQYCPKGVCDATTLSQINREALALAKGEVGAYHPGTAQQARVLSAIIASKQRNQTLTMLSEVTANPRTAAAFADFAKKISVANFQLQRANYGVGGWGAYSRQLDDAAATKWWAYLIPGLQIDAVGTLAKYKAEQLIWGAQYGNPQVELAKAKGALTESMGRLSVAMRALPADQQADIRGAAEGLVGKFDQNLQGSSDDFHGHNAAAILGVGALGSAAAVVAAVPTLIGAIGTAGSSSLLLTLEQSSLGGASTAAGGTGIYEVTKTVGHAVADALAKQTSVSCELGKELAAHGSEILDTVFDNTVKGLVIGGMMGGGMAITLAHFPVLAAVLGTTRFGAAVYQNLGSLRHDYRALVRQCPKLAALDNQTGVSPEALEEQARAKCNGDTADAVASLVSDLVSAAQLAKGAHDVKVKTALISSLLRKNREEGQGLALVSNAQPTTANNSPTENPPAAPAATNSAPTVNAAPPVNAAPAANTAPVTPPPLSNVAPVAPAANPPVSTTVTAATTVTNTATVATTTTAPPAMPAVPATNSTPVNTNAPTVNPLTVNAPATNAALTTTAPVTTAPAPVTVTASATTPVTPTTPANVPAAGSAGAPPPAAPINVGSGPSVTLPKVLNVASPTPMASATPTLDSILPAPRRAIDAGRTKIAAPTEVELSRLTQLLHLEPHATIGQVRDLRALYAQLRHRAPHETETGYLQKEAEFWREASIRLHNRHQSDLEGWFQAAEAQARLDENKASAH